MMCWWRGRRCGGDTPAAAAGGGGGGGGGVPFEDSCAKMDSIWSTRRYAPVTVDIDLLTLKGKKILKAASEKTKRTKPVQQGHQQPVGLRQHLQQKDNNSQLNLQMDPSEGEPLKSNTGDLPTIAP